MASLKITWVRSSSGYRQDQRQTLRALGLKRRGHSVVQPDSPTLRGMVEKVQHLVQVEEADEAA